MVLGMGIVLFGTWFVFIKESEKERVIKKLDELEELISLDSPAGLIEKAGVVKGFRDLLADPFVISTTNVRQANGARSPDELAGMFLGANSQGYIFDLSFSSTSVVFPTENEAQVTVLAKGTVWHPNQGEREESRRVSIRLGKDDEGEWRFESFTDE